MLEFARLDEIETEKLISEPPAGQALYSTFITKEMMGKEQREVYDSALSKKLIEYSERNVSMKFQQSATLISEGI